MPISPTFEAEAARLQVEGQAVLHSGHYLINNKWECSIDAARSCIQASFLFQVSYLIINCIDSRLKYSNLYFINILPKSQTAVLFKGNGMDSAQRVESLCGVFGGCGCKWLSRETLGLLASLKKKHEAG